MLSKLRELRLRAGISQKVLAEAVGVSQQSINKYENHNIEPDIGTLTRLADYFDTSVDYLVGRTEIRRRIEAVNAYDLNERESRVIDGYRRLTEKQRQSVDMIVENFTGD